MRRTRSRCRPVGDAGVAGVLVLSLSAVLTLVALLVVSVASVGVARQRAASVADLAALAAASRALDGPQAACARASRLATDAGGRLRDCTLDGDTATVTAEVRPAGPLGRLGVATGTARAGPAQAVAAR